MKLLRQNRNNLPLVEEICAELLKRHGRWLFWWCFSRKFDTYAKSPEDFAAETFFSLWFHADAYKSDPSLSADRRFARFKKFLQTIAWHAYLNQAQKEEPERLHRTEQEETADRLRPTVKPLPAPPSILRFALQQCLSGLPYQSLDILITSFRYYNVDTGECKMDQEVLTGLCAQHGISSGLVRVRRQRLVRQAEICIRRRLRTWSTAPSRSGQALAAGSTWTTPPQAEAATGQGVAGDRGTKAQSVSPGSPLSGGASIHGSETP